MTARVLVVDDIPANVRLLEARLTAEYFEVFTATNGPEALIFCEKGKIDLILLDVMMPGMDGFEVCRRLKADPSTAHIPVVMITALDRASDRVAGLEAGADDFLTKPVNDLHLMARVRSLVRLKSLTDELRLRASTRRSIGIEEMLSKRLPTDSSAAPVLLIDSSESSSQRVAELLAESCKLDVVADAQAGVFAAADGQYECILVSTRLGAIDPLRLCSQLRSLDSTRFLPIILIADEGEDNRIMRGLELGVNDFVVRPLDRQELIARLRTQLRRKRYNEELRSSVAQTIEMAVIDGLTGLHNRRYLDSHIETLFERASARKRSLSMMIIDLDRFKAINDTYGHDGGDEVLREFARRLKGNVRGIDLACRFGGEEFVIVMPETDAAIAEKVAERVRLDVERTPFIIGGNSVMLTVSIGVASMLHGSDTSQAMLRRADVALYDAKNGGRNRVVARAA